MGEWLKQSADYFTLATFVFALISTACAIWHFNWSKKCKNEEWFPKVSLDSLGRHGMKTETVDGREFLYYSTQVHINLSCGYPINDITVFLVRPRSLGWEKVTDCGVVHGLMEFDKLFNLFQSGRTLPRSLMSRPYSDGKTTRTQMCMVVPSRSIKNIEECELLFEFKGADGQEGEKRYKFY